MAGASSLPPSRMAHSMVKRLKYENLDGPISVASLRHSLSGAHRLGLAIQRGLWRPEFRVLQGRRRSRCPSVHRRRRVTMQNEGNQPVPAECGALRPFSASALLADAISASPTSCFLEPGSMRSHQSRVQVPDTALGLTSSSFLGLLASRPAAVRVTY